MNEPFDINTMYFAFCTQEELHTFSRQGMPGGQISADHLNEIDLMTSYHQRFLYLEDSNEEEFVLYALGRATDDPAEDETTLFGIPKGEILDLAIEDYRCKFYGGTRSDKWDHIDANFLTMIDYDEITHTRWIAKTAMQAQGALT